MSLDIVTRQIADQITDTRRIIVRMPYTASQARAECLPWTRNWTSDDGRTLGGAVYINFSLSDNRLHYGGNKPGRTLSTDELAEIDSKIITGTAAEHCWAQYADDMRIPSTYYNTCPEVLIYNRSHDQFLGEYWS